MIVGGVRIYDMTIPIVKLRVVWKGLAYAILTLQASNIYLEEDF